VEDVDEDEEEDEESRAAVDQELEKYDKARVHEDEDGFDAWYERTVKEKMDDWKREYYKVCYRPFHSTRGADSTIGQARDFV
jgi:5'-3' exoribonuclease 1